ncbi:uncharacterized protein At4g26485-like [Momordica charantia]|uniref:Uncharacterized protein At4g26485-like n=1 Tax=Momordica charantia TaxID=3673 RepID=A0A6J1CDR1_MOMCH|nr:uncharacterized protein At4g26485-like [Momordica charantia]
MHYNSSHKILLVGEGNFSFSVCLATALGSGDNIVATSLDSKKTLLRKYGDEIETTLEELEEEGCIVMHGVNVRTMSQHPLLRNELFDRIVFNFPHAGFTYSEIEPKQIKLHQNLVRCFVRNAVEMVSENGEIHITHKTSHPFSEWEIVEIAEEEGLFLKEEAEFSKWDYPGYINKKGDGPYCNRTFPVGCCCTFKFAKALPKDKHNKVSNSLAAEFAHLTM